MPNSLIYDPVRGLPIYHAGLAAGTDIGLRIALDAICGELATQNRLLAERRPPAARGRLGAGRP